MSMVLHDFYNPKLTLENSRKMLKKGGFLVNMDWKRNNSRNGPPPEKRLSEDNVKKLLEESGFLNINVKSYSEDFYIITATI